MKSSFPIRCSCGQELTLETTGTAPFPDKYCPNCGSVICAVDDRLVSTRIFNKSWMELHSGDFTMAIVLSAMAVECELARVFVKWKAIDLGTPGSAPQKDKDSWDKELRGWIKIGARLDGVCKFLTGHDFDSFVAIQENLAKAVLERHPDSTGANSLKKYFEERLFWKRNVIVHLGKIDFGQQDAHGCRLTAETLFQIVSEMDAERLKGLGAKHKALGLT